jgi:hypothetical protein
LQQLVGGGGVTGGQTSGPSDSVSRKAIVTGLTAALNGVLTDQAKFSIPATPREMAFEL